MRNSETNARRLVLHTVTHPAVVAASVALALTALLYGRTLTLPLFADDLVQIPWLESITWRELWTAPSPYGYYRPVWYSLWRTWGMLAGGLHPAGLHLLNLAAHCAAAWLAGLLAAAWIAPPSVPPRERGGMKGGGVIPACLAAAIFAAFPFACQAVAWPGAVYNPLVSALAAGALLAYDRGRRGHGTGRIGLALLLALLSAFTYEAGLLVGPLVGLAEIAGWIERRWPRRLSAWPLAFGGLFIVTTLVWRALRGAGAIGFGLTLPDVRRNVGYLVQGLIYPTAPLAQRLTAWHWLNPELALWLIALPTLALLAWSGLRRQRGALLLGAGWFALFALPPLVSMQADWFALAPRFLYMTAAGVALVWTAATSEWLARLRPAWQPLATAAVLATLIIPATLFARAEMHLYALAGESIWDAAEAATRERPVLLVNLPMQIEPRGRVYPLGFEGVTLLPTRVTADGLIYTHTGLHDAAQAVSFSIVAVEGPPGYTYQLFGQPVGWEELGDAMRRARAVYLTRYAPGRIHLVEAGTYLSPTETPEGEPLARFEERVTLWSAECACDESGQIRLSATWQFEAALESDATVFAHLLGPDGAPVTQADGYPLLGMRPFWLWQPGETMRDERAFDPVSPGEYTVRLGLWDFTRQARLPATSADGTPLPDQAVEIGPCACGAR
jgi:hypothetical protein